MAEDARRPGLEEEYQRHRLRVAWWEAVARILLAFLLVVMTIVAAIFAIAQGTDPTGQKVSNLLTPLAALVGIAVGYFFGQPSAPRRLELERLVAHV